MVIDWFTVGAQALNFLILMGLLKHFLYRPILDAIDTREKRITSQIVDANHQKAEAHKEKEAFEKKNEAFDADRAELLKRATAAADAEGQRLIAAAHKAADAVAAKRHNALKAEEQDLRASVRRRTSEDVFAVTRKLIADLADARLDASIYKLFIARLKVMSAADVTRMKTALAGAHPAKAVVRSAFNMTGRQQAAIRKTIADCFTSDAAVKFETEPALLGGIELVASGQKLGWNIDDYLQNMQAGVDALTDPEPAASPAT